jgi:hypothetical protein
MIYIFFRLECIRVELPTGLHAMGKLPALLTLISTVAYNQTELITTVKVL